MRKIKYKFEVPDAKKVRMIVHTDCKNEADDQYALVHHLLTPKFIMKGMGRRVYGPGKPAGSEENPGIDGYGRNLPSGEGRGISAGQ